MSLDRYQQFAERVRSHGGVLWTTGGELRDLDLAGRSGCNVRARIARNLRRAGVDFGPSPMPCNQGEPVLVYLLDTSAGQAMRASFLLATHEASAAQRGESDAA